MSESITYEYKDQIFETNNEMVKHIRENVDDGKGEIHTIFRLTKSNQDRNGTYNVKREEILIAFRNKDDEK